MKGWKTIAYGSSLILLGGYLAVTGVGGAAGQALIYAGLGTIGFRHVTDGPVGYKK